MQQPPDSPWSPFGPSSGGPTQDFRPPRADPGFPDPAPHYSHDPPPYPPPQHQFPQPQGSPGSFDHGDGEGGERSIGKRGFHLFGHQKHDQPPPQKNHPPPSGFRIPLAENAGIPPPNQTGPPACMDADRTSPVFVGSAIFPDAVHPCKIVPSLRPPCRVPYGGTEQEHHGRYDLLPITHDMEWVPTRNGEIPPGRRPVEGGYESNGEKLYHALGNIDGVDVPGKTAKHLVSGSPSSMRLTLPPD